MDSLIERAKQVYYSSPETSMGLAKEIIERAAIEGNYKAKMEGLRLIGNSHFLLGRMDSAAFYMQRLLQLAYDSEDEGMQADVMIDIGQTYDKIGLHSLAYDYFRQAHEIRLKIGDPERLSVTFINLAYHFYLIDQLDSAMVYYVETKTILDTIPLNYTTPFLYNELGGVYLKQGKLKEARKNIERAIELNLVLENNWDLSYNYLMLAELEKAEGNIQIAEKYAQKSLDISQKNKISIEYNLIYKLLSELYEAQGKHEQAHEFLRRSMAYSDSLDLAITDQKLLALDQYKTQKENEITTLRLRNENLEQSVMLTQQEYLLFSVIVVLLITTGSVTYLIFKNRQLNAAQKKIGQQNDDLRNLNVTKNKLFSIITHDIRNPLHNINGMLRLVKEGHLGQEEFQVVVDKLLDQTDRLSDLSETLITWSKSQQSGLVANPEPQDLNQLVSLSIRNVDFLAAHKKIHLSFKEERIPQVMADANMMLLVLNNLLNNAIKFTPAEGQINVCTSLREKQVCVSIEDTGVGINEDLMNQLKLGKIQQQEGTENEKGSGLGLMLSLDLITLNSGTFSARKNEGLGSTFEVCLPQYSV